MNENTKPQLYACLRYADAEGAIAFLTALGFTERLVVRSESDPGVVEHAQFAWRDHGGIMFGSKRGGDGDKPFLDEISAVTNLVVASDEEVDATIERAVAAGGKVAMEPSNSPYGGRSGFVLDPEGNGWNIDSYPGE